MRREREGTEAPDSWDVRESTMTRMIRGTVFVAVSVLAAGCEGSGPLGPGAAVEPDVWVESTDESSVAHTGGDCVAEGLVTKLMVAEDGRLVEYETYVSCPR